MDSDNGTLQKTSAQQGDLLVDLNLESQNKAAKEPSGEKNGESVKTSMSLDKTVLQNLYGNVKFFLAPVFESLEKCGASTKEMVDYFQRLLTDAEDGCNKNVKTVSDITDKNIEEATGRVKKDMRNFFKLDNCLETLFNLWYEAYKTLIASLYDVKYFHDYISPLKEDEKDIHDIKKFEDLKTPMRWLCYYTNMNLAHRFFNRFSDFFAHIIKYFIPGTSISEDSQSASVKIEEVSTCSGEKSGTDPETPEDPRVGKAGPIAPTGTEEPELRTE